MHQIKYQLNLLGVTESTVPTIVIITSFLLEPFINFWNIKYSAKKSASLTRWCGAKYWEILTITPKQSIFFMF